ncbi:MAG: hypothetical protein M3220_02335 [Chloroflexota bacterium]|nr:hypothetical protein [Chloroflexota bacterium]
MASDVKRELVKCAASARYFVGTYCWLFDATGRRWRRFKLWPAQSHTLGAFERERLHVILKARQLGLSWLVVAYAVWMMVFCPGSVVLLFSRREEEATELLERLRGMLARLPEWMPATVVTDNAQELALESGSRALSFATTKHGARSFTANLVIIDEADFIRWLSQLLTATKPTIDAGGQLILLSTIDKENYGSEFKQLYQGAEQRLNNYHPIFLPWYARPDRDRAWYEKQKVDYSEDDLKQEYPATPQEALEPRSAQKRFQSEWLNEAFEAREGRAHYTPAMIYRKPEPDRYYLVAADPAEGAPNSDPSAATILDCETWEEVAVLHGLFETDVFAHYLITLAIEYNDAVICPERNNHGHAVIDNIKSAGYEWLLYQNPFDDKPGWLSNAKYKVLAVDHAAQALRDGVVILHTQATVNELAIFDSARLRAPEGFHDDLAMSLIIGLAALRWPSPRHSGSGQSVVIEPVDVIELADRSGW